MMMKFTPLMAGCLLAAAAVMPATANETVFQAALTGAAESPPNASPAFGDAHVTMDDVNFTVAVHVTFSDLSAPAAAGHIHCCTAVPGSGNIGVRVGFSNFPAAVSGTYDNTFQLSSAAFSSLLTGMQEGRSYVNLHTSTFPGGEIRGFLVPAIPEPSTYALMLAGLGLAGLAARRRRAA